MKILEIQERLIQERALKEQQQNAASPLVERVQSGPTSHVFGLDPILDADTIERIESYKETNPELYKKIMRMD